MTSVDKNGHCPSNPVGCSGGRGCSGCSGDSRCSGGSSWIRAWIVFLRPEDPRRSQKFEARPCLTGKHIVDEGSPHLFAN